MKHNPYSQLMSRIHPPKGLNAQVLQAALNNVPAPVRRPLWKRSGFRLAICSACVLLLLLGSFLPGIPSAEDGPSWEFGIRACALDLDTANITPQKNALEFTTQAIGGTEDCCLFQVEGRGITALRLSIEEGSLYRLNPDHQQLERLSPSTEEEAYDPEDRFGFRLADQLGFLTVEAHFSDGSHSARTYRLYDPALSAPPEEAPLSPAPFFHDTRPLSIHAADTEESVQLSWPLEQTQSRISKPFGRLSESGPFHDGVDLPAKTGTAILAAADGVVAEIGLSADGGHYLLLDHGNGLSTAYHHCDHLSVQLDTQVKAGEPIAEAGNTGRSTGPHLHFEVRLDGQPQNPLLYFSPEAVAQLDRPE